MKQSINFMLKIHVHLSIHLQAVIRESSSVPLGDMLFLQSVSRAWYMLCQMYEHHIALNFSKPPCYRNFHVYCMCSQKKKVLNLPKCRPSKTASQASSSYLFPWVG